MKSKENIEVVILTVGMLETNGFIVRSGTDCVVIDPGDEAERFIDHIHSNGLNLHSILLTHGHVDHIGGLADLKDEFSSVPILCHELDSGMLRHPGESLEAYLGIRLRSIEPDGFLEHGQLLKYGELSLEVRHVPGHSKGSVVFLVGDSLIAGDTLFEDSIGRWDLPGGNYPTLIRSIQSQILSLPGKTRVFPGHGGQTTVERELRSNPFFS